MYFGLRIRIAAVLLLMPLSAQAHFIWLVPGVENGNPTIDVRFGEDANADEAEYLSFVKGMSLAMVVGDQKEVPLKIETTDEAVFARTDEIEDALFVATHDLGVMDRGDKVFRLKYYAKSGPVATSPLWRTTACEDDIQLDIVPSIDGDKVTLTVLFDAKPVEGAQIVVARPESDDVEAATAANGQVTFLTAGAGIYSVRARHIDAKPGEYKGRAYPETRHYCTIALNVATAGAPVEAASLQNLPEPVTSFGAAVLDNSLYLYGGHTGGAHSYSKEEQSNQLTRLDLTSGEWETMIDGPHLQGLALVTHGRKLYRIGGFTAENAEGEDHNLWSQDCAACFDPATGSWTALPNLPERRSSHDAAVVGDVLYVVGGWAMQGEDSTEWRTTAWKMDLTKAEKSWEAIANPPFERRALAVAAHAGKLYAVGGMQIEGGPTTAVGVYDPAVDNWSEGPSLFVKAEPKPEDGSRPSRRGMSSGAMAGFGASAFATGGSLYVTTVQGNLQQLSADGSSWNVVASDLTPRFFHRLLAVDNNHLVTVGGANMKTGKYDEVEVIDVRSGR